MDSSTPSALDWQPTISTGALRRPSRRPPPPWWQPALIVLLARWPVILATLAGLALLLAFGRVVASVVEQSHLQRRSVAAQHEVDWRCKLVREDARRAACLAQVAAAHGLRDLSSSQIQYHASR